MSDLKGSTGTPEERFPAPEDDPRAGRLLGQRLGYARVSAAGQNLDRQREALREAGCARLYEDTASGARGVARPQLAALLSYAREGDVVVAVSVDRLARSVPDLLALVDRLTDRGVGVELLSEGITLRPGASDAASRLILTVLAAVADLERSMIRERQRDGITQARQRGVYTGRAPALTASQVQEARRRVGEGVPKTRVAADLGIGTTTLYSALRPDYRARDQEQS